MALTTPPQSPRPVSAARRTTFVAPVTLRDRVRAVVDALRPPRTVVLSCRQFTAFGVACIAVTGFGFLAAGLVLR